MTEEGQRAFGSFYINAKCSYFTHVFELVFPMTHREALAGYKLSSEQVCRTATAAPNACLPRAGIMVAVARRVRE